MGLATTDPLSRRVRALALALSDDAARGRGLGRGELVLVYRGRDERVERVSDRGAWAFPARLGPVWDRSLLVSSPAGGLERRLAVADLVRLRRLSRSEMAGLLCAGDPVLAPVDGAEAVCEVVELAGSLVVVSERRSGARRVAPADRIGLVRPAQLRAFEVEQRTRRRSRLRRVRVPAELREAG